MVPWWKRKADLLCAILQLRISCFIMSPGLSGMSSFGTVKRKLLVMPEEALSISVWALSSLCLGIQKKNINKFKKIKRETGSWFTVQWWCWRRSLWQSSLSTLEDWILVLWPEGVEVSCTKRGKVAFPETGENTFDLLGWCGDLYDRQTSWPFSRLKSLVRLRHKDVLLQFFVFLLGHAVCWLIGIEQVEDDLRGCCPSQTFGPTVGDEMGNTATKFRKALINGDELLACQLYESNPQFKEALDPNSTYGESYQHNTPLHYAARHAMTRLLRLGYGPNKSKYASRQNVYFIFLSVVSEEKLLFWQGLIMIGS